VSAVLYPTFRVRFRGVGYQIGRYVGRAGGVVLMVQGRRDEKAGRVPLKQSVYCTQVIVQLEQV
jgi:hypothetical protein